MLDVLIGYPVHQAHAYDMVVGVDSQNLIRMAEWMIDFTSLVLI